MDSGSGPEAPTILRNFPEDRKKMFRVTRKDSASDFFQDAFYNLKAMTVETLQSFCSHFKGFP